MGQMCRAFKLGSDLLSIGVAGDEDWGCPTLADFLCRSATQAARYERAKLWQV